jgi:Sec-independent protein translocase protein TatA
MSFWELMIILLVALIVIKPERFPEIMHFLGRCFSYIRKWQQLLSEKYNQWM